MKGNVGETVEHAVGMIPVVGPPAVDMTEDVKHGRYAEAAGKLASFLVPEFGGRAAEAIQETGLSDAARASAEKSWQKVLNPTTKVNKALVEDKVAPGLIDRHVKANSLEGLQEQAQGHIDNYGQQIDDYFDEQAAKGASMDPTAIIQKLSEAKDEAMVDGVSLNESYTNKLDALKEQIQTIADKNGGKVPLEKLRKIRAVNDQTVAQSKGGFALSPDANSQISAVKTYTDAIRGAFAKSHPQLADLNKEFSFWKNVDLVTDATITRRVGQRQSLMKKYAQQAGGVVGGATGAAVAGVHGAAIGSEAGYLAAGKLADITSSSAWNSRVAIPVKMVVSRLAKSGRVDAALAVAEEFEPKGLLEKGATHMEPVPDTSGPVQRPVNQSPHVGNRLLGGSTQVQQPGFAVDTVPVRNPDTGQIEYVPEHWKGALSGGSK